jgi:hypothetical protein
MATIGDELQGKRTNNRAFSPCTKWPKNRSQRPVEVARSSSNATGSNGCGGESVMMRKCEGP